jgi:pyrroline-5-carboxylate reductase
MSYKYEIGFIGCGNMGSAILRGILSSHVSVPEKIGVTASSDSSRMRLVSEFEVNVEKSNSDLIKNSKVIFLAIKPKIFENISNELKGLFSGDQLIISIMAGKSIAALETALSSGSKLQIVRAMPNTPALVGEAMSALSYNEAVTEDGRILSGEIFDSFGLSEEIPENLMDAVTGVSGSSPAYIYMMIEAMADEGVRAGLPRQKAYKFAAQAVLGSAKMVLETGKHPGELKDAVTSPGGTTIAGLAALEEMGFRGTVMEGIHAAIAKSIDMSK